jgi:hypothetical protein
VERRPAAQQPVVGAREQGGGLPAEGDALCANPTSREGLPEGAVSDTEQAKAQA